MTDETINDHASLVNAEAILADLARCTPDLAALLPHLDCRTRWATVAGAIYFKPPPNIDPEHQVYLLFPFHLFNPLGDATTP